MMHLDVPIGNTNPAVQHSLLVQLQNPGKHLQLQEFGFNLESGVFYNQYVVPPYAHDLLLSLTPSTTTRTGAVVADKVRRRRMLVDKAGYRYRLKAFFRVDDKYY